MAQREVWRPDGPGRAGADPRLAEVLRYLPEPVQRALSRLAPSLQGQLEEVRLRAQGPLSVTLAVGEPFITPEGQVTQEAARALRVSAREVRETVERMAGFSVYALEEEFRRGYLTLPGGHRVGLAGRARLERGRVRTLTPVTGLDVRVARQVVGSAQPLVRALADGEGGICSTLVVGPPRSGKTTLLRDLARLVSGGWSEGGIRPASVAVVDERSELGGAAEGLATLDLGPRTDLLDGCPKAEGLVMAVRALAPRLLVTDELGDFADVVALREAAAAGVRLLASLHADSLEEAVARPLLAPLVQSGGIRRWVLLSRRPVVGSVRAVRALRDGALVPVAAEAGP